MGLAEKLESWAKSLDRIRWQGMDYDTEAVELADLLSEAAKALRGCHSLVDEARHALAKH